MVKKTIEMPLDVIIYGSLFYPIIFLIGVAGNLLVIYVLFKEKQLRSFTNYLLANLSFADLMVLFTCVPGAFHDLYAKERWYLGKIACYLVTFVENCMGVASILSIFMITFERYYVICQPLKFKSVVRKSHIVRLICSIWLLSITINLPFIYLTDYKLAKFFDKNTIEHKCVARTTKSKWSIYYTVIVNFLIYFFIGIVLLVMYYRITKCLKKSNSILRSSLAKQKAKGAQNADPIDATTNSLSNFNKRKLSDSVLVVETNFTTKISSSTSAHNNQPLLLPIQKNNQTPKYILDRYIIPRKQLIFMLMCVIAIFYICLLPIKLWTLLLMCFGHNPRFPQIIDLRTFWYINITSRMFFYMNSSINPIVYNMLSKKFRQSFKRLYLFGFCFKLDTKRSFSSKQNRKTTINKRTTSSISSSNYHSLPQRNESF